MFVRGVPEEATSSNKVVVEGGVRVFDVVRVGSVELLPTSPEEHLHQSRSSSSGLTRGPMPFPVVQAHPLMEWSPKRGGMGPRVKPEDDARRGWGADVRRRAGGRVEQLPASAEERHHRSRSSSSGLTRGPMPFPVMKPHPPTEAPIHKAHRIRASPRPQRTTAPVDGGGPWRLVASLGWTAK